MQKGTFYTAQCDENRICRNVTATLAPISIENQKPGWVYVPLNSYDISRLGKYWNGSFWEDVVP